MHELLTEKAARQAIGEHGLVALDWHSGNRSVLVNHELSGLVLGQTLATRPEDQYRALLESTAYGTRMIVETFQHAGVPVTEFVVAGGLLKNELLMQIYADVLDLPLSTIDSQQGPALGSAIHAAVAAGAYADVATAARAMGRVNRGVFQPDQGQRGGLRRPVRRVPRAPRPLRPRRQRRDDAPQGAPSEGRRQRGAVMTRTTHNTIADLRAQVAALHAELTRNNLVAWTAGNVSARVPGEDLLVIKPSGVSYDELTADAMVVCDLDGNLVEGDR